jgi:hypothetical protein
MLNNNIIKQDKLLLVRGNSLNAEFDITLTTNVNPLVEFGIRETLTSEDLVYASTVNNKIVLLETLNYSNLFNKKYKLVIPYLDTIDLPVTDINNDGNCCNDKYLLGYLQITYDTTKELLLELQVYVKDNYNVFT